MTTAQRDMKRAITRRYDISDFLGSSRKTERNQTCARIMLVIMLTVAPESWIPSDGTAGSITFNDPKLVVHHTPEVIWQIDELMEQLREEHIRKLLSPEEQP